MSSQRLQPDAATLEGDERTLSVDEILSILWRGLAPLTLATLGLHLVIWGWPHASADAWAQAGLWLLVAYVVAIVVHELLHILPMLAAGVRLGELHFGVRWRDGVVFVHGDRPVTARWYRFILALPGFVLGVAPVLYGISTNHAFATMFGYLMLVSAVGDWAILRLIRDVPSDALIIDHSEEVGCIVLP
ncbi:MAG: DUF3267 domain-containing protein [Rhodothermales bacterium]|nr:DUF3267 domain-containing protein [Rhodothermales bacterium]MBO6781201.1 DUF3267 domain-containing protein [Rhodothermales bacterium]